MKRLALIAILLACVGVHAEPSPTTAPSIWMTSLHAAIASADEKPILLFVGATSCDACRSVDMSLKTLEAAGALRDFTLLRIDFDEQPDEVRRLEVNTIPSVRLLSPKGGLIESRSGPQTLDDLRDLLSHRESAISVPTDPALSGDDCPTREGFDRLLELMTSDDTRSRRSAIARVAAHRFLAADVVDAFAGASMRLRLALLDVLSGWDAPMGDIDPWRPESITPESLARLREWAALPATRPTSGPSSVGRSDVTQGR